MACTYLWFHVGQQTPKWLIFETGPQIPQSIDNGRNGQMHDTFLRSNLAVKCLFLFRAQHGKKPSMKPAFTHLNCDSLVNSRQNSPNRA